MFVLNIGMELKTLELEPGITVRAVFEGNKIWFLVSDICKCLKTKTKPARFVFDNEECKKKFKVKIGKQHRECLFVDQDGADSIISKSRGKENKKVQDIRYDIWKNDKKLKILPNTGGI